MRVWDMCGINLESASGLGVPTMSKRRGASRARTSASKIHFVLGETPTILAHNIESSSAT